MHAEEEMARKKKQQNGRTERFVWRIFPSLSVDHKLHHKVKWTHNNSSSVDWYLTIRSSWTIPPTPKRYSMATANCGKTRMYIVQYFVESLVCVLCTPVEECINYIYSQQTTAIAVVAQKLNWCTNKIKHCTHDGSLILCFIWILWSDVWACCTISSGAYMHAGL